MIEMPQESVDRLELPIETSVDPAGATIEWQFTALTARPTGSWFTGAWKAPAQLGGTLGWIRTAMSPMLGTGALDLAPGYWQPWARTPHGDESPVFQLSEIILVK